MLFRGISFDRERERRERDRKGRHPSMYEAAAIWLRAGVYNKSMYRSYNWIQRDSLRAKHSLKDCFISYWLFDGISPWAFTRIKIFRRLEISLGVVHPLTVPLIFNVEYLGNQLSTKLTNRVLFLVRFAITFVCILFDDTDLGEKNRGRKKPRKVGASSRANAVMIKA